MKAQKWKVTFEGGEVHTVAVAVSRLIGSVTVRVDDDVYELRGKPFGFGFPREERCLVGMAPALLSMDKSGRAQLKVGEGAKVEKTE